MRLGENINRHDTIESEKAEEKLEATIGLTFPEAKTTDD